MTPALKAARTQYLELPARQRRKSKKPSLAPLTEERRKTLESARDWLEDFRDFLTNTLGDSEQNRRQVTTHFSLYTATVFPATPPRFSPFFFLR